MLQPFDSAVRAHGPTVLRVCRAVLGSAFRVDVVRRRTRGALPVGDLPERSATSPTDAVAGLVDLRRAMALLPTKQRHCVAYHHLGGLGYDEVARIVGGSPAAAWRAASDGVAALRRRLITTELEGS